ncbi:MAG: hypothetical protein AB8I08_21580 [Sandaracinaceae bacterium]
MANSGKKAATALGGVLVFLLLGVGVLWALRGSIATSMARGQLEERHITCDDRFSVSVGAAFGSATIGPTRCEHEGGLLEAVELLGDVTVELDGTEPETVSAESLRIVLRETDVRGGSGWASELSQLGLEQRVAGMVKGLSELGGMNLPATDIATVSVVRGTTEMATATRLRLGGGTPSSLGAARIHFAAGPGAMGQLTLTQVTGELSPPRVLLRGQADASVGIAILRVNRRGAFTMEATGLDTAAPSFTLDGDF